MPSGVVFSVFFLILIRGLAPAGVLMVNFIDYWRILQSQDTAQMLWAINALRDFLVVRCSSKLYTELMFY